MALQGCSNKLLGLGLFCCDVGVSLGVLLFFFPGLRQRKHKKGKNGRKNHKSKLGMLNTFKTQVCLNAFQIPLSLVLFSPFWVVTPSPASLPPLSVPAAQIPLPGCCCSCSVSPKVWHQAGAAGAQAGLCCVLSSCCIQLPDGFSSHLPGRRRRAQSSPPPWPGTSSLSRTAQGQRNCPHGLGAAEPLAEPLWPNSVKPLQPHHAQGQLCWGSTPEPATRCFKHCPTPLSHPLDTFSL